MSNLFEHNSIRIQNKVSSICNKTDASHFKVINKIVKFKKNDGLEIELKHFKSLIPNGYYFCTNQTRNSIILD